MRTAPSARLGPPVPLRCRPARVAPPTHACARPAGDELLRTVSLGGELVVLTADATRLVREATRRHNAAPTAAAALGRALVGALLLSSFRDKDGEQVTLTWRGDGPLGQLVAVASAGRVRGTVGNAAAHPPLRADGKLAVGTAVGAGILAVVRSHASMKAPSTGLVAIQSGEIAADLAHYLADSEQLASAIALGVSLGPSLDSTVESMPHLSPGPAWGAVRAAGGWFVQVLPGCSESTLSALESNIQGLESTTAMLESGIGAQGLAAALLSGIGSSPSPASLSPSYGPCDETELRVRMRRAVAALGRVEAQRLLEEGGGSIEVTCEFCRYAAAIGAAELEGVLGEQDASA